MKHTSIFLKAACRRSIALLCTAVLFTASVFSAPLTADAASPALVILSRYRATLKIGDSFTLAGIASNGKWVRFKSSKSAVASVNTYGRVTAKKRAPARLREKSQVGKPVVKLPSQNYHYVINCLHYNGKRSAGYSERADLK